jgi:cytoskeletal protein RodZ
MIFKSKQLSKKNTEDKKPASARPKFKAPFRPMEIAIILGVLLLGTSGILYQKHEQKIHQQLNIAPASNQSLPTPDNTTPTTTQPTQSTTPAKSITTPSSSASSATACKQTTIPYGITYQDDPSLPAGQTQTIGGMLGIQLTNCNGKTTTIPPTNATEFVGTGTSSTAPTTGQSQTNTSQGNSGLTESQAAQQCDNNLANGADASDPQGYLITCMHQYGY